MNSLVTKHYHENTNELVLCLCINAKLTYQNRSKNEEKCLEVAAIKHRPFGNQTDKLSKKKSKKKKTF